MSKTGGAAAKSRFSAIRRHPCWAWLEYLLFQVASFLLAWLPFCFHAPLSWLLSRAWWYLFPIRKAVIFENLLIAFPDETGIWRKNVAIGCVRHFVRLALECSRLVWRGLDSFLGLVESVDGLEDYAPLSDGRNSVICITGHLGNWELLVASTLRLGKIPAFVFAKPMHNALVDAAVIRMRRRAGIQVITTRDDTRAAMRALRNPIAMGFLADQDARRSGVFVPFFGRPASTFTGPALFAQHFNIPQVFLSAVRVSSGRYKIHLRPPVYPDPASPRRQEIDRLTALHVRNLEDAVRANPDQYFWFHRRWKTKPKANSPIVSSSEASAGGEKGTECPCPGKIS